jgi:hypothetical protein
MNLQNISSIAQLTKLANFPTKQKLLTILAITVFLLLLVMGIGAFYLKTKQANHKTILSNLHWQTYTCKYRGYSVSIPDEVGISMWDGWYGADPECPIEINGGIRFTNSNEDLLKSSTYKVIEERDVIINGFNSKYAKLEHTDNSEHLLIYQFKGEEYIHFMVNLNYKDSHTETDFYKDTEWGKMIESYSQEQNKGKQLINIIEVFNEMAKTIKLIPALPMPTKDPNQPMIN